MKNILLTLFIIALWVPGSLLLSLDPNIKLSDYVLETWGDEQGLPNNTVLAILQAKNGYLWLGTQDGLVRFDGATFSVYYKENKIPGTYLQSNWIDGLYEDKNGRLLIRALGEVKTYYKDGTFFALDQAEQIPAKNEHLKKYLGEILTNLTIHAVVRDKNHYWVGTNRGLYRMSENINPGNTTIENGLLENTTILSICKDHEGNLWLGTQDEGLKQLKESALKTYTSENTAGGLANDNVRCTYYDPKSQTLWIGTQGGLSSWQNGEFSVREEFSGLVILSIYKDKNGSLWIGTKNNGLKQLKNGRTISYTTENGLNDNKINCIGELAGGILLVGTEKGLCRLTDKTPKPFTVFEEFKDSRIDSLYVDNHGGVWIGTFKGLQLLRNGRLVPLNRKEHYPSANVLCLYEDRAGVIWIGTGEGFYRYKNDRFTLYSMDNGLFDNVICQVLEDMNGNFWLSGNRGISQVIKRGFEDLSGKKIKTFGIKDGMKSRECNSGSPGGAISGNGGIWFPTIKGLVRINSNHSRTNSIPPRVVIENFNNIDSDINVGSQNIPHSGATIFKAGTRRVNIYYTALSFVNPKKVKFKYKLEGFYNEWTPGTARKVSFIGLPPGEYIFKVKACNNDGVWNEQGASLTFAIEPYFYQTWWFPVLCLIALALSALYLYWIRSRKYQKQRVILENEVDERTIQLQDANMELETIMEELREANQIAMREREAAQEASKAKSEFLANMSHEIRTPMNAILGFSEIMENDIKDQKYKRYLHAISSSSKTLMGLINDILDLSRIEAGKIELEYTPVNPRSILNEIEHIFANKTREKALDFSLEIDPGLPEVVLLDGLRLRQVLLNLVGNAVKFTHNGFVKLTARAISGKGKSGKGKSGKDNSGKDKSGTTGVDVLFSVQDSGIGIPEHQRQVIFQAFEQQEGQQSLKYGGTGLGLAITLKLVQLMNGGIKVKSEVGKGSTFEVILKNVKISSMEVTPETDIHLDVEDIRFEPACIVVADDNELNRQLLIEFLNKSPIECVEAENGKHALDLVRELRPDLVLMDFKMPVMSGGEACKIIKTDDNLKQIPVIIVTAAALKEQWPEINGAMGDSHLNKPLGKSDLIIELMQFLPYSALPSGSNGEAGGEPVQPEFPGPAPGEGQENIPQLLEHLQRQEIAARCETLRKTLILDDIEEFLGEMKELALSYRSGMLFQWVNWMEESVQHFDLEKIQQSLAAFPEVLRELKALNK